MTTTKHIHHDVIIEWAKGATIQYYDINHRKWIDCPHAPTWSLSTEYRVKPATKKYRVALMHLKATGKFYTITVDSDCEEDNVSSHKLFIHWITDWIEYEV